MGKKKDMRTMDERERFMERVRRSGEKEGAMFTWGGEDGDGQFFAACVLFRGKSPKAIVREFRASSLRSLRSYLREYGLDPGRFNKTMFRQRTVGI